MDFTSQGKPTNTGICCFSGAKGIGRGGFSEAGIVTEREHDIQYGIFSNVSLSPEGRADAATGLSSNASQPSTTLGDAFSILRFLPCRKGNPAGQVLLVIPLTGHQSVLFRDLVLCLAETHDVAVLDWKDARDVPDACGPFGFDDQIHAIVSAIKAMPASSHILAVCQSGLPVLTAAAALGASRNLAAIQSLTFMGVPFDPAANPTDLSNALSASSRIWLELFEITTVDQRFDGAGRRIYPGTQQLARVQSYIMKHTSPDRRLYRKLCDDDGLDPESFPFERSLTNLKDIPADLFLENIDRYFHRQGGQDVVVSLDGKALDADALIDVPVLTLEGDEDDIVAPGQTSAIHQELPQSAEALRENAVVPDAGHFDLFHGRVCRQLIVPHLLSFFARASSSSAIARPEFRKLPHGENRNRGS